MVETYFTLKTICLAIGLILAVIITVIEIINIFRR